MVKFEIYKDQNGGWSWRLRAANGEIVCWGESYTLKQGAANAVNWVKANAAYAPVYEL